MSGDAASLVEAAKRKAAYAAVDELVRDGMVVGIGSGSTVVYVVERLAHCVRNHSLQNIVCVPSSFQARQLIVTNGLFLSDLERTPTVDVCIDGADEMDDALQLIKGGGGALLQEKILAFNSKFFAVVADYRKQSKFLGENWTKGLPVEVLPSAYVPVMKNIRERLHGTPVLRSAIAKAGPVVTDNGLSLS